MRGGLAAESMISSQGFGSLHDVHAHLDMKCVTAQQL